MALIRKKILQPARQEAPSKVILPLPEQKKILRYLENPFSNGLWSLRAEWLSNTDFTSVILSQIENKFFVGAEVKITFRGVPRRVLLTEETKEEITDVVSKRISFVFALFSQLRYLSIDEPEESDEPVIMIEHWPLIFSFLDFGILQKKFDAASKYFNENIWCPGLASRFKAPNFSLHGIFIVAEHVMPTETLSLIAWDELPLRHIKNFFLLIGKIDDPLLMPLYSPEEELFEPYITFLNLAYEVAVPQKHLQPFVLKAITNFTEQNYTDAVSALGLAAEDTLTQIYETLYREQLTKGLTLGQLTDEIHNKAAQKLSKKEDVPPTLSVIFPEIKAALEDEELSAAKAVALMRKIVVATVEQQKHMSQRIDKVGRPERKLSLYPEHVGHAVNELIRYRNAASHKSRVPIGPAECKRMAFSFVLLISWWLNAKRHVDWTLSQDQILRVFFEKNNKL